MRSSGSTDRLAAWALAAALMTGACSESSVPGVFGPEVIEETQFAASLGIDLASMTRTASGLYIEDLGVGSGEPARAADVATVTYTGWLSNGSTFDAGTFSFTVGAGHVVPGFDEGVSGMRVGGTRRILIPPSLAYGNTTVGAIPGGSILIFSITLDALD